MKIMAAILCIVGSLLAALNSNIIIAIFGWCLMWSGYCLQGGATPARMVTALLSSMLLAEIAANAIITEQADGWIQLAGNNMAIIAILLPFAFMPNLRREDIATLIPPVFLASHFQPSLIMQLAIALAFMAAAIRGLATRHHSAATAIIQLTILWLWLHPAPPYSQLAAAATVLCAARIIWLFYSPPCSGAARHSSLLLAAFAVSAAFYGSGVAMQMEYMIEQGQFITGTILAALLFWRWMDNRYIKPSQISWNPIKTAFSYPAWLVERVEWLLCATTTAIVSYVRQYAAAPLAALSASPRISNLLSMAMITLIVLVFIALF